jgi:hypothetical protein
LGEITKSQAEVLGNLTQIRGVLSSADASGSNIGTESGDLVLEDSDNVVQETVFVVSLVLVVHVGDTLGNASSNGIVVGRGGLEVDFPSLVFMSSSSLDGNSDFVEVDVFLFFFSVEVDLFGLRVLEPDGEVPSALDFSGLELGNGFFEVSLKLVEEGEDLFVKTSTNDSSSGDVVGFLDELESFTLVVGGAIIPVGISAGSELVEFFESLLVEEVLVHGELLGSVANLGKVGDFSLVGGGDNVVSEDVDDLEGVRVLLEGADEDAIGVAALVLEFDLLSVDFDSSVLDPLEVSDGVVDFSVDVLSVGGGGVSGFLVGVSDGEQVSDFIVASNLLSLVLFISVGLSVVVSLSEIKKNLES